MKENKTSNKIEILDILFDQYSLEESSNLILKWLKEKQDPLQNLNDTKNQVSTKPHDKSSSKFTGKQVVTPNPEILLEAQKNSKFKEVLNQAELSIPDGTGIILASKFKKEKLKQRVTGVDLMETVCQKIAKENLKVFLLGAAPGVAKKTKEVLENKYPGLAISGTYAGSPKKSEESKICEKINQSEAQLLFVAFGAPKQELWIYRNLKSTKNLTNIKVAIGIGGSFDFISGRITRAPKWMQKIGLEWLYRLIKQPSRIKRIFNATIIFPWKFITHKKRAKN